MTVKEMAQKYYPALWSVERIEALVAAGKLSREDADEVINSKSGSIKVTGLFQA